jgi:serine phosphatase RsbU (regulator of sigma subunit)
MPFNLKLPVISAFALFLFFGCGRNELKKITVKVHAEGLSDSGTVYITGGPDQLGDWDPSAVKLKKDSINWWSRTFYFRKGEKLEYDFTRGSYSKDSFGPKGLLYPFHHYVTVNNDTILNTNINGWKDKTGGSISLNVNNFANTKGVMITSGWKYHPGDSVVWADPDYNDSNWEVTTTTLNPGDHPLSGWNGIGWFRIKVNMDSALLQNSFMFNLWQAGASEIYLDGKLLNISGKVGSSKENEILFEERNPRPVVFTKNTIHLFAVRFSDHSTNYFNDYGFYAGFEFIIGYTNDLVTERLSAVKSSLYNQIIFAAIPFTLAMLHFIIFIFYPRYKENIFYALCMIGFAGIVVSVNHGIFTTNLFQVINLEKLALIFENMAIIFGLLTAYYAIYGKFPKHGWIFIAFASGFIIWNSINFLQVSLAQDIFLVLVILEMLRCILFVVKKTKKAASALIGFLIVLILLIYQLLVAYGFINPVFGITHTYLFGALILSISMSIRLSQNFAATNKRLEEQLVQVKELSYRALEHERREKEQEIEKRLLEADNKRKTIELEEARRLQLAMLPKVIPKSENWEIDVFMRTATEVGGDYYDFHTDKNGTLTIAVGDATGHGVNAGTMVAVIKSLFGEFAENENITETFNKYTTFIKSMNLGNLYMAMTIAKMNNGKMTISSAGMPPVLIYRAQTKKVEEIILKGMPLGGFLNYPYAQVEIELGMNDLVIFMSDGLPEMFNKNDQIFSYEKTREEFESAGNNILPDSASPGKEIIETLLNKAEEWANGRNQEDDITFVVLKNIFNRSS